MNIKSIKNIIKKNSTRKLFNKHKKFLDYNNLTKQQHTLYKNILKKYETKNNKIKKKINMSDILKINKKGLLVQLLEFIYTLYNDNINNILKNTLLNIKNSRIIETDKTKINNILKPIIEKHMINSKYIDNNIIQFINTNLNNCKIVVYTNIIEDQEFIFKFVTYDNVNINKLDGIVRNMLIFLQVLIKISGNKKITNKSSNICSSNGLQVNFFMSPFTKKLDLENNHEILGAKNINSGFNYPCISDGLIIIYRKQEMFKVFIHESIHAYGIDGALHTNYDNNINYKNLINLFAINNNIKDFKSIGLQESITEFWTFIIHLFIGVYNKTNNFKNLLNEFERLYKLEVIHSCYQISKILYYNNLNYNDFINKNKELSISNKYNERSHIFSYIIIKLLLIINHEDLLKSDIFNIIENKLYNENINIRLKKSSIDILFKKLANYASNKNLHLLIDFVEKYYKKNLDNYKNKQKQRKTLFNKKNKNRNYVRTKKNNYKNKDERLLNNLNMMSLDYNL